MIKTCILYNHDEIYKDLSEYQDVYIFKHHPHLKSGTASFHHECC